MYVVPQMFGTSSKHFAWGTLETHLPELDRQLPKILRDWEQKNFDDAEATKPNHLKLYIRLWQRLNLECVLNK